MEISDSLEECRGDYDEAVDFRILQGILKLLPLLKKKLSKRSAFENWKHCIISEWVEKYLRIVKILEEDSLQDIELEDDENKSKLQGPLGTIITCIEHCIKSLIEHRKKYLLDKEKWAIHKKKIEQLKNLEKIDFADPIVERIKFWKNSLFPEIGLEAFWTKLEYIDKSMKITILETELMNEKKNLQEKAEDAKNINKILKKREYEIIKKEQELSVYQEFLENECKKIQRHWNEIGKIADSIENKSTIKLGPRIPAKRCQSLIGIGKILTEPSIPEISASHIEPEESFSEFLQENNDENNFLDAHLDQFSVDITNRLKKNAIRTVYSNLKFFRYFSILTVLKIWKKNCNVKKNKTSLWKFENNYGGELKSQKVYNSRRQLLYDKSTHFTKEKKKIKVVFIRIFRSLLLNWKEKRKVLVKFSFFKWKTTELRSCKEKNRMNMEKSQSLPNQIKVIFLLSVFLSRSIISCKLHLAFQTWNSLGIKEKNKECITNFDRMNNKISENISREQSNSITLKIAYEKLKSKLNLLESQVKTLQIFK